VIGGFYGPARFCASQELGVFMAKSISRPNTGYLPAFFTLENVDGWILFSTLPSLVRWAIQMTASSPFQPKQFAE